MPHVFPRDPDNPADRFRPGATLLSLNRREQQSARLSRQKGRWTVPFLHAYYIQLQARKQSENISDRKISRPA